MYVVSTVQYYRSYKQNYVLSDSLRTTGATWLNLYFMTRLTWTIVINSRFGNTLILRSELSVALWCIDVVCSKASAHSNALMMVKELELHSQDQS